MYKGQKQITLFYYILRGSQGNVTHPGAEVANPGQETSYALSRYYYFKEMPNSSIILSEMPLHSVMQFLSWMKSSTQWLSSFIKHMRITISMYQNVKFNSKNTLCPDWMENWKVIAMQQISCSRIGLLGTSGSILGLSHANFKVHTVATNA